MGEPDKPRVFLSYARGDDEKPFDPAVSFVARLHSDLAARGFDVWFDRVSMPSRQLTFHQEIRDAIANRDKLILVIGPRATASKYVSQEWQFAIEADKVVIPILRRGNYPLIPEALKLLHCEDFRDGSKYTYHLEKLTRILSEPLPPLGQLFEIPGLPAYQVSRHEIIKSVRKSLRADLDGPVVIAGANARVGLHGMGGVGKSVLAATIARDRLIREAFPDGVLWVGLGQHADVLASQGKLHRYLGGDGALATVSEGISQLQKLLKTQAVLLIVDDAWHRADVDAFDVLGPRCRALVTTRDKGLLQSLGAVCHDIDLLTHAESLALLALVTETRLEALPGEAQDIVSQCGRLPLAIALCGGMLRARTRWEDLLAALRDHELEFVSDEHAANPSHRDLWKAMELSILGLPQNLRDRFSEFSVLAASGTVPEVAVLTLWTHRGGVSSRFAREQLLQLQRRSLVRLDTASSDGAGIVSIHALLYDLSIRLAHKAEGTVAHLHQAVLDAYAPHCLRGWVSGPNDGYFLNHIRTHLIGAGRASELANLLQTLEWLEVKNGAAEVVDLANDFAEACRALDSVDPRRQTLTLLRQGLGRELQFIHRHRLDYPQGLFQCLWNACWWHDNTRAILYLPGDAGTHPAAVSSGPMATLLETWRADKERRESGFSWVRDVRPPSLPLESSQRLVCRGHAKEVRGVAFSPDGHRIGSASVDKTARIWDADTGTELLCLHGHEGSLYDIAFSPVGPLVATASADKTIRIWDLENGAERCRITAHEMRVRALQFSPNGLQLATCSSDGTVRLFNASTGERLHLFTPQRATGQTSGPAIGDVTLYLDQDSMEDVFALQERTDLQRPGICILCLAWSPTGRLLAFGGSDNSIRIYETEQGNEVACLLGHVNWVTTLTWFSDESNLVTGANDGTVRVWDWRKNSQIIVRHLGIRIRDVAYTPRGDMLALCTSSAFTPTFLDARDLSDLEFIAPHENEINAVAFARDQGMYATAGADGNVRVWDVPTRGSVWRPEPLNHLGRCADLVRSPDGLMLGTCSDDRTIRLWDSEGVQITSLEGHQNAVCRIAFSPDGTRLASVSLDKTARVWSPERGDEIACTSGFEPPILGLRYGHTGHALFVHQQHAIGIWSQDENQVTFIPERPTGRFVEHFAVSNDDSMMAIATYLAPEIRAWDPQAKEWKPYYPADPSTAGHLIEIWDLKERKMLARWPAAEELGAIAFPQSTHFIAYGSTYDSDRGMFAVQILDYNEETRGLDPRELRGHGSLISELVFSKDLSRLASKDKAGWVNVWDVETGACIQTLEGAYDLESVVEGPNCFPWVTVARAGEIEILFASSGATVGRYPAPQVKLLRCASSHRWAGISGRTLNMFELEKAG